MLIGWSKEAPETPKQPNNLFMLCFLHGSVYVLSMLSLQFCLRSIWCGLLILSMGLVVTHTVTHCYTLLVFFVYVLSIVPSLFPHMFQCSICVLSTLSTGALFLSLGKSCLATGWCYSKFLSHKYLEKYMFFPGEARLIGTCPWGCTPIKQCDLIFR